MTADVVPAKLPHDWIWKKLKYIARMAAGDAITSDDIGEIGNYPVYGGNGLRGYTEDFNRKGDFVLIGRQGALCGNINYASGKFWASEHAIVADLQDNADVRWLGELLSFMNLNQYSQSAAQPGISVDVIANLPIPVPPQRTQKAIAQFLDRETADIDALISAKQRLLDLLAEKRRAIVAEAIMRGLNPAAPLRSSGIDWLGDIPAHWETIPLRFLVSFIGGATPDTRNLEYWSGTIPWVSPKDMKCDFMEDAEDHVSAAALANSALKMIGAGAILIVVRGMILAHSFPTAINTVPVTINQDMKAMLCVDKIASAFLVDVLKGAKSYLVSLADSSAHGTRKLETEALGRFDVPVPPLAEQQEIVRHIATETAKIDRLRAATEHSVTLLKERRGALIAAAVTGQIDIPEML